jgi:hypothetical protein
MTMAYGDATFMRDDPQILLKRLSDFVQPIPAKVLAKKAGCTEDTAEHFRLGRSWPNARHWLNLIGSFGTDITDAVFHPERALARLQQEVQALEQELAAKRAALGAVADGGRSFAPSGAKARARHENRSAALSGREVAR